MAITLLRPYFACLFSDVVGLALPPTTAARGGCAASWNQRGASSPELVDDPETPLVYSALLAVLQPRQVAQTVGGEERSGRGGTPTLSEA